MSNWYSTAIFFLGGAVVGLLAFLFLQPTGTSTNHQKNGTIQQTDVDQTVPDVEDEKTADTESEQREKEVKEGKEVKDNSGASDAEQWAEDTELSASTPHLIFYYKPGWPLCQSTKDIVDDLRPDYVGDIKFTYIPKRSKRGIEGRKKYNIPHGMVLLDKENNVFWKEAGLSFRRATIQSKLKEILNNE